MEIERGRRRLWFRGIRGWWYPTLRQSRRVGQPSVEAHLSGSRRGRPTAAFGMLLLNRGPNRCLGVEVEFHISFLIQLYRLRQVNHRQRHISFGTILGDAVDVGAFHPVLAGKKRHALLSCYQRYRFVARRFGLTSWTI